MEEETKSGGRRKNKKYKIPLSMIAPPFIVRYLAAEN